LSHAKDDKFWNLAERNKYPPLRSEAVNYLDQYIYVNRSSITQYNDSKYMSRHKDELLNDGVRAQLSSCCPNFNLMTKETPR